MALNTWLVVLLVVLLLVMMAMVIHAAGRSMVGVNPVYDALRLFVLRILQCGPMPRHMAFIMDGNRRWAEKRKMERHLGHYSGFEKLKQALDWCLFLGVEVVTVYAFSTENFKRPQKEVETLMTMCRDKFNELAAPDSIVHQNQTRVRILGALHMCPPDVQKAIANVVNATKHHTRATLNVCIAYTSKEELVLSLDRLGEAVQQGDLLASDVSKDLIDSCMYTAQMPEPDMLVRTSGEVRLSDFLLWQSTFTVLVFVRALWPDYSFWGLCACVLQYQREWPRLKVHRQEHEKQLQRRQQSVDLAHTGGDLERASRVQRFLSKLSEQEERTLLAYASQ